jgi:methyl-accepting chemotaxis protein
MLDALPMLKQSLGFRSIAAHLLAFLRDNLPKGTALPDEIWQRRHRGFLLLLWGHAFGVAALAHWQGFSPVESFVIWSVLAAFAALAGSPLGGRRVKSLLVSFGLMTSSAFMVHASGGYIEMHFHYFVIVTLLALYQDWAPFLLAVSYVGIQHGVGGVLMPHAVYNHPDAWAHPMKWALIHAAFFSSLVSAALSHGGRRRSLLRLLRLHRTLRLCCGSIVTARSRLPGSSLNSLRR